MAVNLCGTVIDAASLSRFVALGERHAREYLATLSDTDANSLWKCLRRLGWWIPDDQQSTQERLAGWLFRDDVRRLDFSDGTERFRVETPEERLADATEGIMSLARAVTIEADSCLAVASYVRALLEETGRNNPPLYRRCRRDWPSEFSRENPTGGMRNVTNDPVYHEEMRFDEFCIRFDGELLDGALSAAATRLDLPSGRLKLREPTGYPLNDELYARRDLVSWLESWRDGMMRTAWERQELPSGWEPRDTTWPDCPIKTVEHLREWLSSWLAGIHQARSSSRSNPERYLEDIQRELRNARWSMRAWGISLPTEFNDQPADIHEAERQLVLLIDGSPKPADDMKTEATSEPPKPVELQAETLAGGERANDGQLQLKPCVGKAWSQFQEAVGKNSELTTDRQAYDWFVDEIADDADELPSFANWSRYLRTARKARNQGKNGPRIGNETRSVVSAKRIERPRKRIEADR